jgi:hypothetical protein
MKTYTERYDTLRYIYNIIYKESLMIINSFGIPKTKPKQSRQLPKTPKQNKQSKKPKIITKYQ